MRREVLPRIATAAVLALSQPACVVAGGYSSDRGFYVWPGSLLSILVIVVLLLLLRRRRR
jgi:hypothetical protein